MTPTGLLQLLSALVGVLQSLMYFYLHHPKSWSQFGIVFLQGVFQYRIRWKGYSASNDTWEYDENLASISHVVKEFDANEDEKLRNRQRERNLRKVCMLFV